MADRRLELHTVLCDALGSTNVYFQPPESVKMSYPAIVYNLNDIITRFADNEFYTSNRRYTVILIDPDPDSEVIEKLASLPLCQYSRHYTADNLNHEVFEIYY